VDRPLSAGFDVAHQHSPFPACTARPVYSSFPDIRLCRMFGLYISAIILLALASSLTGSVALASEMPPYCADYPNSLWPRDPDADASRPFYFTLGPYHFAVPWKYLAGRPPQSWSSCTSKKEAFGIQFWIPDGRAPEKDVAGTPEFRPVEHDRDAKDPNSAVVSVHEIKHYEVAPRASDSPDNSVRNILTLYGPRKLEPYGDLTGVGWLDPPGETRDWFRLGTSESILFSCIGPPEHELCKTYLDLKDEHLIAFAVVPKNIIHQHVEIILLLRKLLQSWQYHP
jgi:hypothetical protein